MDEYDRQMLATLLHELADALHYPITSASEVKHRVNRVARVLEHTCYECGMVRVQKGRYLCDNCLDIGMKEVRS